MRSLAVRVLHDFGVDGIEPQSLGSRKARLALHLLALAGGQVVTSAALEDALWGDTPPAKPDDQLAVLVSRLRSVLGRDRIEHRDHGYLLRCDWLDATELAGLTEEIDRRRGAGHVMGAAAAARVALSLIRGDGPAPLPGEWAQLKRADLERLIRRARQVAATALLDAGDWMAAADAAAAALERDPYDEAALRVLLRAQVTGGRVAAALAAYASTRERLADELGTNPSPETEALQLAILRGELAPPGPAAAPASPGLVGRDDELGYLDAVALRARGGSTEVVVIDGEAGIGKTTLLRSWADRRAAGGDTVLMAACGPLDRALPLDAVFTGLAGLLRLLGLRRPQTCSAATSPCSGPCSRLARNRPGPPWRTACSARRSCTRRWSGSSAGSLPGGPVVVAIDDAHLAGLALPDWLRFVRRGASRWPWWPPSVRVKASRCRPPWGWSTRRPPCTRSCSPGARTRSRAARPWPWPRSRATPRRRTGARCRASRAAR